MKKLHLDTIEYEYDEDASWEKDGKTYEFVSLKKITSFKDGKQKFQTLTVKHEHLDKFKDFLRDILGEEKKQKEDDF